MSADSVASRLRLATVAVACVLAACGVKTDPRPPEDTAPRAPDELEVRRVESGVALRWRRPAQSVDGERLWDLAGFLIERRPEGGDFSIVGEIAVADNERIRPQQVFTFEDSEPPAGMIFYRVRAFNSDGQQGNPTPPVLIRTGSGG